MLPERLEDYVGEDNPVRFIEGFVDRLDMAGCGFVRSESKVKGRPGYDPRDLLKLYLYGYSNRIRSSRMLERACGINLEVIWLMRRLRPDHKTIAEFRRLNPKAFKQVFRRFLMVCRSLGLLGGELVAIDGTQLKAVNNPRKNITRTRLQRQMREAEAKIEDYLRQLDDADARERGGRKLNRGQLESRIGRIEMELQSMEELDESMARAEVTQVSQTDPESRAMAKNPRIAVGFNAQVSADEKHGLIVAETVTNDVHDYDQLEPMARESMDHLGHPEKLTVTADKGYDKTSQLKAVEQMGCECHVPARHNQPGKKHLYSKDAFRYLKSKDAYRCPAGKLLPRRYESTVNGQLRYSYCDPGACLGCAIKSKCTTKERGRTIVRRQDEAITERIRERMRRESEKYKRRGATVEKVFGTIKWAMGAENLLMKGLGKCQGEWSLLCTCYNLKRVMNLFGVKKLLEALGRSLFAGKTARRSHQMKLNSLRASLWPQNHVFLEAVH